MDKKDMIKKPKNMFEWANLFEQASKEGNYSELVKGIMLYEFNECKETLTKEEKEELEVRYDNSYEKYMELDYLSGFVSEEVKDIFLGNSEYLED